jgi:hypothetical protein
MKPSHNSALRITTLIYLLATVKVAFAAEPGVVNSEFIYEKAPFPQCHASTIAETKDGLVAAWFGGTAEKNKDVGIWISTAARRAGRRSGQWERTDTVRYPCWNPVLFQMPNRWSCSKSAEPQLVVGSGLSPEAALGTSRPAASSIAGPIKNKPILLMMGALKGPSTEDKGWRVHGMDQGRRQT